MRIASDLHLEQWADMDVAALEINHLPKDDRDLGSVLVLAGDISSSPTQLVAFIKQVEQRFKHVIYLAGNHEWYRHEVTAVVPYTESLFKEYTVNTSRELGGVGVKIIEGTKFIFGTLWADGGSTAFDRMAVERGLWDFNIIRVNGLRFTVARMQAIHKAQKAQIIAALKEPFDGVTVVATHHMPSYRLCHPRFGTDINGGFASNCEDILAYDMAPDFWVFGHTHDVIDTKIFNTRCISNPSGYRNEKDTCYNDYCMGPKFFELETTSVT